MYIDIFKTQTSDIPGLLGTVVVPFAILCPMFIRVKWVAVNNVPEVVCCCKDELSTVALDESNVLRGESVRVLIGVVVVVVVSAPAIE